MRHKYEINDTETNDMVCKAKNKKAMGIDFIPNEVLKHKTVIITLWNLFRQLFCEWISTKHMAKSNHYPYSKRMLYRPTLTPSIPRY